MPNIRCDFVNPNPAEGEKDIRTVSAKSFLERATQNTLDTYQKIMNHALDRTGPVLELVDIESTQEKRLVIGYKRGGTQRFFSALSDLYHYYDLYSTRKYVGTPALLFFFGGCFAYNNRLEKQ